MSALSHASPRLEAVAVVNAQRLDLYVDDHDSNAPLAGLDVRLQTASSSTTLSEREPGLYSTAIDRSLEGTAITLQIRGPDWLETVSGSLTIDEAAGPAAPSTSLPDAWPAAAIILLVVGLLAYTVRRRR